MKPFIGKTAVVTGASQGLGACLARELAKAGATVLVNAAVDSPALQAVVEQIRAQGGQARAFPCDVSNEREVNDRFGALEAEGAGVDILINNARLDPYSRTADCTDGDWWDRTLAVNLKGAYLTSQAVLDPMKKRGWGRIINVSSVWADRPAPARLLPYSVSKAGLQALSRGLAREGAPEVSVNAVAPGLILTENVSARLNAEQLQRETAEIPLQRGASTEEIVRSILHLLEDGFVTGQTLHINGGVYMGL